MCTTAYRDPNTRIIPTINTEYCELYHQLLLVLLAQVRSRDFQKLAQLLLKYTPATITIEKQQFIEKQTFQLFAGSLTCGQSSFKPTTGPRNHGTYVVASTEVRLRASRASHYVHNASFRGCKTGTMVFLCQLPLFQWDSCELWFSSTGRQVWQLQPLCIRCQST
jgi:hypothetical protein